MVHLRRAARVDAARRQRDTSDFFSADKGLVLHLPANLGCTVAGGSTNDVLIVTWHIGDKVRTQLNEVESCGGRFVVPGPQPTTKLTEREAGWSSASRGLRRGAACASAAVRQPRLWQPTAGAPHR